MGRKAAAHRPRIDPPTLERRIAEIAATQHGVIALRQLAALGLSGRAARHRVASGRLHRIYRGVYAVGHPVLSPDGRRFAAVLACGDGAVVSHRSAARMWHLLGGGAARIDVTTPSRSGHAGPADVALHRTRRLDPEDVTTLRGVPITTVARTILDLADVLDRQRLARAVHEAEVVRVLDVDAVARVAERMPGRRGRRRLAAVLVPHTAPAPGKTVLEDRFARFCREHDLPAPRRNVHVDLGDGRFPEVDALFADEKVIVELDGATVHHTRRAFEHDRAKDAALAAHGYVVVRLTWRRLTEDGDTAAAELRQTLRARMTQFQDTSSRRPGTFITARAHGQ